MGALTVLLVGAFAAFSLFVISIQLDVEANHRAVARALIQQMFEDIRSTSVLPATGATVLTATSPQVTGNPSLSALWTKLPGGTITRTINWVTATGTVSASLTGLLDVSYTATWPEPGHGQVSVTLDSYVTLNGVSTD